MSTKPPRKHLPFEDWAVIWTSDGRAFVVMDEGLTYSRDLNAESFQRQARRNHLSCHKSTEGGVEFYLFLLKRDEQSPWLQALRDLRPVKFSQIEEYEDDLDEQHLINSLPPYLLQYRIPLVGPSSFRHTSSAVKQENDVIDYYPHYDDDVDFTVDGMQTMVQEQFAQPLPQVGTTYFPQYQPKQAPDTHGYTALGLHSYWGYAYSPAPNVHQPYSGNYERGSSTLVLEPQQLPEHIPTYPMYGKTDQYAQYGYDEQEANGYQPLDAFDPYVNEELHNGDYNS